MSDGRDRAAVWVVTGRGGVLRGAGASVGLRVKVVPVQDGPTWPTLCPPVVIDTIGMAPSVLVALLVDAPPAPLVALAAAADWRTLRLLESCPAVGVISPVLTATLPIWLRHLDGVRVDRGGSAPIWLLPRPPLPPLGWRVMRVLHALQASTTLRAAAQRCGMSESSLYRLLRATRVAVGLPSGAVQHVGSPTALAEAILDRLAADGPRALAAGGS